MLFNSLGYIIFFPCVTITYFLLPHRFRWAMLLLASLYFYMAWKPEYVLLILVCIVVNYSAALVIERLNNQIGRRLVLIAALILSLGMLFYFKYAEFISYNLQRAFNYMGVSYPAGSFSIILPIGISFFTFQALSYTIDVYHRKIKAERHIGYFSLYVVYFPQLVAGPIMRADRLIPQLREKHHFCPEKATGGLRLILWGLFIKMVVADNLAVYVNAVYNNITAFTGFTIILATIAFAFQIYCDFAGYSYIAIGSAKTMGIDLICNFNYPYISKNMKEFWRRWHISLSTWFRDYVYIPLGGNRRGDFRKYLNLFFTFTLSGLWHGAAWTFVIWGMLHGLFLIFENMIVKLRMKISPQYATRAWSHDLVKVIVTFSLVCFAWIFFRANSLGDAVYAISHLIPAEVSILSFFQAVGAPGIGKVQLCIITLAVSILLFVEGINIWGISASIKTFFDRHRAFRWACYMGLIILIMSFGIMEDGFDANFIYFQF